MSPGSLDVLLAGPVLDTRPIAGAVAAVIAWRTGSMTATIDAGMAVLWGVHLIGG